MQQRTLRAYSFVREHLQVVASRSKCYYDLLVRPQRYQVGDWVYYFNPRKYVGRQKWSRKFAGSYEFDPTLRWDHAVGAVRIWQPYHADADRKQVSLAGT